MVVHTLTTGFQNVTVDIAVKFTALLNTDRYEHNNKASMT